MPTSATHQQKPTGQFVTSTAAFVTELRKNTLASEMSVSESIKAGILVDEVLSDKALADRLIRSGIIPRRTLQYAAENNIKRFTPAQSERIVRTMRVTMLAQEAFGDKADEWLDRPTTVFAGETPAGMLVTEAGARAVEMFIGKRCMVSPRETVARRARAVCGFERRRRIAQAKALALCRTARCLCRRAFGIG